MNRSVGVPRCGCMYGFFLDVGLTIVATRKPEVKLNQKQNGPTLSQLREKIVINKS